MPAHPRGERSGGKGAKHQEHERIRLQVLWHKWRGKANRPGAQGKGEEGGEVCSGSGKGQEEKRRWNQGKKSKENDCSPKVVL